MATNYRSEIQPLKVVQEKGTEGASLWIKQPESQKNDASILAARLCSCSDVCLAVMEDH